MWRTYVKLVTPELKGADPTTQRIIVRKAFLQLTCSSQFVLGLIIVVSVISAVLWFLIIAPGSGQLMHSFGFRSEWWIVALFIGLITGLFFLLSGSIKRIVRQQLNCHGYEFCIPCGYDLRGVVYSRCPECGSSDPFKDPWRPFWRRWLSRVATVTIALHTLVGATIIVTGYRVKMQCLREVDDLQSKCLSACVAGGEDVLCPQLAESCRECCEDEARRSRKLCHFWTSTYPSSYTFNACLNHVKQCE